MGNWLAVVSREHVRRGVDQGIVQTNHGAKAGVARMTQGDGLVFYSPREDYPDGAPVRAFTAIGRIADGEPWQAAPMSMGARGTIAPWRRRVEYLEGTVDAPIAPLLGELELTRGTPNWGMLMRRGLLPLSDADFAAIARAMGADTLVG